MGKYTIIKNGKEIEDGEAKSLDYVKVPKGASALWIADENWGRTPEKKSKYNPTANNGD